MTPIEIVCVVIGFLLLFNSTKLEGKFTDKQVRYIMTRDIICKVISGLMVLLPLYFRYWKG